MTHNGLSRVACKRETPFMDKGSIQRQKAAAADKFDQPHHSLPCLVLGVRIRSQPLIQTVVHLLSNSLNWLKF